jgi:hypothetical protein
MRLPLFALILSALTRAQEAPAARDPATLFPRGTPIYVEARGLSAAATALRDTVLFSPLDAEARKNVDGILADLAEAGVDRAAVGYLPALILSNRWIVVAETTDPAAVLAKVAKRIPNPEIKPATADLPPFFVLADSQGTIETVLALRDGKESGLSDREDFRRFRTRMPDGSLRFHLDLKKLAPIRPGLGRNDDIGAVLFGHHATHVAKTARTLSGSLDLEGGIGLRLAAEIDALTHPGAFTETRPAQTVLVPPPDCVLRLSLPRDLRQFWNERESLLRESARAPLAEFQNNLSILMGGLSVEDLFAGLGSGFDLYVSRGDARTATGRRYPSVAVVGALRDPALGTELLLTFQTTIGIVNAQRAMEGLPRFFQDSTRHRDVLIASARLLPELVPDKNDDRIQLEPSLAVVKGRVIVGTNRSITRAIVDQALDDRTAPREEGDRIEIFGPPAAAAYQDASAFLRSQMMLEQGRTAAQADEVIAAVTRILSRIERGHGSFDLNGGLATLEIALDAKGFFSKGPESR